MSVKLSSTKADTAAEQEGDWIAIPDLPGVAFRVRSIYYEPFVVARNQATRQLIKRYGQDTVPEADLAKINGLLYVEHILIDWRGLADDDGNPIAYTVERGRDVLTDPAYREVRDHVAWAATQVGKARVEFVEASKKTSLPPSAGA